MVRLSKLTLKMSKLADGVQCHQWVIEIKYKMLYDRKEYVARSTCGYITDIRTMVQFRVLVFISSLSSNFTYQIHPDVSRGVTSKLIPNHIGFCQGHILIETATYSYILVFDSTCSRVNIQKTTNPSYTMRAITIPINYNRGSKNCYVTLNQQLVQ